MRKQGRKLWKAITMFMITAMAFGTLQAFSVTSKAETTNTLQENEYATISEEEIKEYFTISAEEEAEYAVEAAAASNDGIYPESVDLSGSRYFPAIMNQGNLGACQSYAFIYTMASFAINQSKGITSTNDNCLNPLATYSWMEVANAQPTGLDTFKLITQLGVPTCGKWSYYKKGSNEEVDYGKRNAFYTSDDIWLDALNHRVEEFKNLPTFGIEDNVITKPKDKSLNAMKEKLNEGKLLGISTYFNSFQYSKIQSKNHKGEHIVTGCYGAAGGHVMVIVGYDDDIWVDINGDGEDQEAEKGAFKVANSHSRDYGNDGFVWVSYDAFNKVSQVPNVGNTLGGMERCSFGMTDSVLYVALREKENSGCLCYVTVNTAARRQMKLVLTARNNNTGECGKYTFPVLIDNIKDNVQALNIDANGDYAWDGSTSATDANFVIDLDNVISDITPDSLKDYTWSAIVSDSTEDSKPLTVKRLQIKSNGNAVYTANLDAGGTKVNGNSQIFLLDNGKTLSGKSGVDVNGNETDGVYENGVLTLGASWCYRLNSFQLKVNNNASEGGIEYRLYQNGTWTDWVSDGELCGNNAYDTNFVQIRLTGKLSEKYDVCYKTTVYGGTWSGWTANGEKSGSSNRRVEGVKVTLTSKDTSMYRLNEDKVSGNLDYGTCNETLTGSSGKDSDGKDTSAVYDDNILKLGGTWNYALKWFKLGVQNKSVSGNISYRAYQNGAWTDWVSDGTKCGDGTHTIQYVEIKLTGELAEKYDICYKTIVYGGKWYGWTANGETAGDGSSNRRVEGLQVQLLKKGTANSLIVSETEAPVSELGEYNETLSGSADRDYNGNTTKGSYENTAFTLGSTWCYQLNSMKINVDNKKTTGSIKYRMYQNGSWTDWVTDGSTCGDRTRQTYLLQIQLTGNLAKKYDIYYQTTLYGGVWTEWSKNGAESGSLDSSRIVEGVRIKLVKKGSTVDTNVTRCYTVTFKDYDGTVLSTQTVFKGQSANAPGNPTRTGYTFTGWDKTYSSITGNTVITAQYKKDISVSSYKFNTEKSSVKANVELSVTLNGASSNATCRFIARGGNYTSGSKDNYFTMSSATTGTWTPDMDGTYEILVDITDSGKTFRYSICNAYKVEKESDETTTTIYYKGYTNPKIHYQVGSGSWTSNNGVYMTPCTDVEGFDYVITIDLNGASGITACFNDGSGNWDNNNRQNYKFGAGYYTCKNGVITKIDKPSSELRINSVTSSAGDTIQMGTSTTITINAGGGAGGYKYNLYYNAYGSGKTVYLLKESSKNTAAFTPDYARETYLSVDVIDNDGNKVSTQKVLQVNDVTENQITIYYKASTATNIHYQIGSGSWTKVPGVAMEAASEKAGYYKKVINLGTATTLTACFNDGSKWDNNNSKNYYFDTPGIYTVKDKTITKNDETTTTIYYKGYANPKIHYQVGSGSWTSNNGVYMTPCTDVEGFDYVITIDLNGASGITACFNDGSGNWDNNNRQNYKFGAGYYTCKNGVITKIDKPSS